MAKRPCIEPGCPVLTTRTRCTEHERAKDKARGTRQARGYDAEYDAVGRDYQRRINDGHTFTCWRCSRPLGPQRGLDWQLGHCDDDRDAIHGPECPACNLATRGREGPCPHPRHR